MRWLAHQVDLHSGVPIYLQLRQALTRSVQRGTLRPGDSLPTVRSLAGTLRLAPNTVTRAYAELQRDGLIESRAGAGTAVSARAGEVLAQTGRQDALLEELRDLLHRLLASGMPLTDVQGHLADIAREFIREAQ